mmetsp:Transcript_24604/g.33712  ORF Transcript_24604/g.33712 Transcript_24604/m.33712 type:complete len:281 (+) Transcript_24604:786-1628(+)
MSIPTLVTEASCSCSPSMLRNSGSISIVRLRSKERMSSTLSTDTCDFSHRTIGANLLICRSRYSTRLKSAVSGIRSILFTSKRSAKATCSTASFSAPSGFSSSRCCSMCLASMRVTIPSSLKYFWIVSSTKNVCATGAGSAMPVVSITTASSWSPFSRRFTSFFSTSIRSWRTVQQTHPLSISTISSSLCACMFFFRRASSIPTSPNSFSITAIFRPCCCVRMWLRRVVFPLPRNPVSTVTGTRRSAGGASSCSMLVGAGRFIAAIENKRAKGSTTAETE